MGYAQNLIDEVESEQNHWKSKIARAIPRKMTEEEKKEVEEELSLAIQQELEGNLSPMCAQNLIDAGFNMRLKS